MASRCPLREFFEGVKALFQGISIFWSRPRWWGIAALPAVVLIAAGVGLYFGALALISFFTESEWAMWGGFLVLTILGIFLFTLFITLYELIGGLFFDSLTARTRYEFLGLPRRPKPTTRENLTCLRGSVRYACGTLLLLIPVGLLALIPYGHLLVFAFLAWRFTVPYLFSNSLLRGETPRDALNWARAHRARTLGFAVAAYLLFAIPYAGILVVPAIVVGAVLLRENTEFHPSISQS